MGMTESRDTWTYLDTHPGSSLQSPDLAGEVGREHAEVLPAVLALAPTYVQTKEDRRGANMLASITGASLVAALQAAADDTDDPERRSTLRRIGDGLAAAPANVASGVVTAWLSSQVGALSPVARGQPR